MRIRKICSKCKKRKGKTKFYKNKALKYGLNSYCKECMKDYQKEHYFSVKKSKDKYQNKPESIAKRKIYMTNYYKKNKERILDKAKKDRKNNPEKYENYYKKRIAQVKFENKVLHLVLGKGSKIRSEQTRHTELDTKSIPS